jgi:hypothetical protein
MGGRVFILSGRSLSLVRSGPYDDGNESPAEL